MVYRNRISNISKMLDLKKNKNIIIIKIGVISDIVNPYYIIKV
jgi:hypothetical protein